MGATTWAKFYWADWMSDLGVRRSSALARGIWMDMLCIAAAADPVGFVAIAGRPLGAADLARVVGEPEKVVAKALAELRVNGVVSVDRRGCFYSRRMVEDEKKRRKNKENGHLGGNPTLLKHSEKSDTINPPDKAHVRDNQIPDTNSQKERDSDDDSCFLRFPADGPIGFSRWGALARKHAAGWDPDVVASNFRKWAWSKDIDFGRKGIRKTFETFCKGVGKP